MLIRTFISLLKNDASLGMLKLGYKFDLCLNRVASLILNFFVGLFDIILYSPSKPIYGLLVLLCKRAYILFSVLKNFVERILARVVQVASLMPKLADDVLIWIGSVTAWTLAQPFLICGVIMEMIDSAMSSMREAFINPMGTMTLCRELVSSAKPLMRSLMKPSAYGMILATAIIGATSNADVADEMKVLIEQRKSADAYALGEKHPELMGDPLFDYFFGVASVETGHTSMGVLSLERVLLNDPNNDLVRLELARAYYAQAEYIRAKDEFEAVKKNQPPAGVVSTINTYLDDIKAKEAQYKPAYGVFVELGMGYNNNVNAATAVNNICLLYTSPSPRD